MHHLNAAIYGNASKKPSYGERATAALPRQVTSSRSAGNSSDPTIESFPPYDPSPMYGPTDYQLPSVKQLKEARIVFDMGRDGAIRVEPVDRLLKHMRSYLPPARPYYDQFTITIMKPFMAQKRRRCGSCWSSFSHGKATKCKIPCLICRTDGHHGAECPMVYATVRWWKEQVNWPKASLQLRPNTSELVYLLVAGVFLYRPGMSYQEPLVVNMEHPLVRDFYGGVMPKVLLPDWMEDLTTKTLEANTTSERQTLIHDPSQDLQSQVKPDPVPKEAELIDVVLAASKQSTETLTPDLATADPLSQESLDEIFDPEFSRMQKEDADDKAARTLHRSKERRDKKIRARQQEQKQKDEEKQAAIRKADADVVMARQRLEEAQRSLAEKEQLARELKSGA